MVFIVKAFCPNKYSVLVVVQILPIYVATKLDNGANIKDFYFLKHNFVNKTILLMSAEWSGKRIWLFICSSVIAALILLVFIPCLQEFSLTIHFDA